jgi:hypothetical protein
MSLADITKEIQLVKSAMFRNVLDNIYHLNHGRWGVVDGQVNMDDMLTSRPGGVVRMDTPNAVTRLDTPALPQGAFEMFGYLDTVRDGRTGVSKMRTGLDPDVLANAKTGAVTSQMDSANARIELIARVFAETGVKDIFRKMYQLVVIHQDKPDVIRLRNKWVDIDPTSWQGTVNVKVSVGLGHGSRDQMLLNLQLLGQQIAGIRSDPEFRGLIKPEHIHNLYEEALKNMGFKNAERFISNPDEMTEQQPDPAAAAEQAKQQLEQQKLQMDAQKMQMEMQKEQAKFQMEQEKFQLDVARLKSEFQQDQQQNQINMTKLQADLAAAHQQNQIEHEKSMIEIAKLKLEKDKVIAEMQMQEAENELKREELEVERSQARSVDIGND